MLISPSEMHLSLRTKFILALLLISLAAVGVFGLVARGLLLRDFGQLALENAFESFRMEVSAYINAYGSLDAARRAEPFQEFQERYRGAIDARIQGSPPPFRDSFPPQPGSLPGAAGDERTPPFKFLLLDLQNRVVLGDESYPEGETVPDALLRIRFPIVRRSKTVAWAVPLSRPSLGTLDVTYLRSIHQSLIYAIIAATVLAIALGVVVGTRLSHRLWQLTQAIQAVGAGELVQQVHVKSRDEIGILAEAFNRASAALADAHKELQQSNAMIAEQARQLREQSIRDELTGLFNRRFFDEQAARIYAEAVRYGQPLTLLIADLDRFKQINDERSHATGDAVLRIVGQILQRNIRESDLVARYGGEEFVIAFCHSSGAQSYLLADRLRTLIEGYPWHEIHPDLQVTISMGLCADLTQGGFERMLAVADANLYQAKASGRNRVCTTSGAAPA